MSAIASNSSLLGRFFNAVETGAANDASLASAPSPPVPANWRGLIDRKLIEWGRSANDSQPDDEFEPPSPLAVARAFDLTRDLIAEGADAPTRAVPNGDGGFSFEWESGSILGRMEFNRDGSVDSILFDGARLVKHDRF